MNHFADESFCNSTGCGHRFGRVSAGATLLPDSPRFLLTQSEEGVTWQKVLVSYCKCRGVKHLAPRESSLAGALAIGN
jgi:hypothetical protein